VASLLAQAQSALSAAQAAEKAGNHALAQQDQAKATQYLNQVQKLLGQPPG
jgi:hypothetical protein